MKRAILFALMLAGSAAAAYAGTDNPLAPLTGTLTVVTGPIPLPTPTPPPPAPSGTSSTITDPQVTLPDLIYFGTCWWQFQAAPNIDPPLVLGNGYRRPHVTFDDDGSYFAGTVEKADASGNVTDVILAFAAAKTGPGLNALNDVTDNALLTYGAGSTQATHAATIYAGLMGNAAYAHARIHVTGLSLGAAFTQYLLGYSIVTYGKAVTAQRADFVQFATPGYAQGIATHFGLQLSDFDGLITSYNVMNDPEPANIVPGGLLDNSASLKAQLMGSVHWLADYQPYGTSPLYASLNGVSAHESFAYLGAFGWPAWLTADQKQASLATLIAVKPPTDAYDPNYGLSGVGQTIIGDGAANTLVGTASDDVLQGRGGADVLTGGGGRNTFVYAAVGDSTPAASDLITDFGATDVIDLSGLRPLQGFAFVGAQTPHSAGAVGYHIDGGDTVVEINTSGGAAPDMVIRLAGVHQLSANNLALGGTLSAAAAYLLFQAYNTTGDPFIDHAYLGFTLK